MIQFLIIAHALATMIKNSSADPEGIKILRKEACKAFQNSYSRYQLLNVRSKQKRGAAGEKNSGDSW